MRYCLRYYLSYPYSPCSPPCVNALILAYIFGVILSTNAEFKLRWGWCFIAFMLVIVDSLQNVITKYLLKKGTYHLCNEVIYTYIDDAKIYRV